MTKYTSKSRGGRSSSQKSVTGVLANNCNNIVIALLGSVFGSNKQRCEMG